MSIATKRGDGGETGLAGGIRVSKSSLRVEAYGTVDELNGRAGCLRFPNTLRCGRAGGRGRSAPVVEQQRFLRSEFRLRGAALVALVVAALAPLSLSADSLEGRVLDPQGRVVAKAQVQLFDRNSGEARSTLSLGDGAYSFRGVSAGDYLVEAGTADAALSAREEIELRGDRTLDLELEISSAEVEVVVTASGTPLSVQEVAKAVDVVDSEQIALRNEFSISEAIRNVPGLRVQQMRGPGGLTTVQTRGMRAQDTALLIDGLRFRDAAGAQGDATAFYEDMMIVDTERIEVLRGSGSSLYGSHAIGGVINISSSQGGGRPHGDIRAEGGGLGMLRGVARVGGGLAEDRFVYSGGFSHLNVTEGLRGGVPYRNSSAQGFAKYNFTPKVSLSGRLWGSDAFLALSESPTFTDEILANFPATGPVAAIALPQEQLERFEAGLPFKAGNATYIPDQIDPDNRRVGSFLARAMILQHQLTPNASYRLAYQGVDTNRSFQDGPGGPGEFEPLVSNDGQYDGRTDTFQARTDLRIGQYNLVTIGYEFEREKYFDFNTDESAAPIESTIGIEQNSQAIFAQDQIRLFDGSLHIGLSGRAQFFELKAPFFEGSDTPYDDLETISPPSSYTGDASLAYFFRESQTKLRAHVGNAYRAPSAYERFGGSFSSFSDDFTFYGDPRLNAERSLAVDAGVDQWLFGAKARLSATVFYTNLQETVIFDSATFPVETDPFGRFLGYRNGGGGIARGAEVSGQVSPTSSTSLQAAYTFTNSDSRQPQIAPDYFAILGLSSHTFTLTATQWVAERFNVTFDLFAVSDYSQSPYGSGGRRLIFGGPVKADVMLRYDIPIADRNVLEVYSKVENVFDNDNYEDGFATPGVWAIGGLRFRF